MLLPRVSDVRKALQSKLANSEFVTDKSGVKMIEIVGASFLADEESIFGKVDQDYVQREIDWYRSQSLYVQDIEGTTPKIWQDVSSKIGPKGRINSNYGYLCLSEENGYQYDHCLQELLRHRETRRAVMIYTRPSIQREYNTDGMSDFICTNAVQYVIRNGKMDAIVQMRSNDAWAGYRNDRAWQDYVLDQLVKDYNSSTKDEKVGKGNIIWNAGSLHIYSRNLWRVEAYGMTGFHEIEMDEWKKLKS